MTNHISTLVSQEIIKLWSWFYTCNYTFSDPTNRFNHLFFVSSGKPWFLDENSYVISDNNNGHNDNNSDNNGTYFDVNNHEIDANIMVIMITMIAIVMIMRTRL